MSKMGLSYGLHQNVPPVKPPKEEWGPIRVNVFYLYKKPFVEENGSPSSLSPESVRILAMIHTPSRLRSLRPDRPEFFISERSIEDVTREVVRRIREYFPSRRITLTDEFAPFPQRERSGPWDVVRLKLSPQEWRKFIQAMRAELNLVR